MKLEQKLIKKINLKKKNSRVYYVKKSNTEISNNSIDMFKKLLKKNKQNILRVCFHKNDKEQINEMLIITRNNFSNDPHRQKKSSISYNILKGKLNVNIYNNKKKIIKKYLLGERKNDLKFLRLKANIFRSISCIGKYTVFMETSCGPFKDIQTQWMKL
jgi:cupin fold WbuC family metalloprotein